MGYRWEAPLLLSERENYQCINAGLTAMAPLPLYPFTGNKTKGALRRRLDNGLHVGHILLGDIEGCGGALDGFRSGQLGVFAERFQVWNFWPDSPRSAFAACFVGASQTYD